MTYEELCGWLYYFKKRPYGWQHDHRTYMLLSQNGAKQKPGEIFSSLAAIKAAEDEIPEEIKLASSLVSSGMLGKLMQAAADNHIEWKLDDQISSDRTD